MVKTIRYPLMILMALLFAVGPVTSSKAQDSEQNPAAAFFDLSTIVEEEGVFVIEDSISGDNNENDQSLKELDGDPCPKPRRAYNETPNDLKLIQEDITRFTLCVQRAQLLERLNELAIENTDTIDSALESNLESIAAEFAPELPDIPMPSGMNAPQPPVGLSTAPLPQGNDQNNIDWEIRELTGTGANIKATLINTDGRLLTIEEGSTIPDTEMKVKSIKSSGVIIQNNDEKVTLSWRE